MPMKLIKYRSLTQILFFTVLCDLTL